MRWVTSLLVVWIWASGSVGAQETPRRTVLFAFFANGTLADASPPGAFPAGLQTDFTFTNPGQKNARITVRFLSSAGAEVSLRLLRTGSFPVPTASENSFDLPARSSSVLSTVPEAQLFVGWVRIESTEPITALETINRVLVSTPFTGIIRPTLSDVVLTSSSPVRSFAVAVTENQLFSSGIAIAVPESSKPLISGTLTLSDTSGMAVTSRTVTIRPREQLAALASELFPGISGGTITGEFDEAVIVTSIAFGRAVRSLAMGVNLVSGPLVD